MIGDSGGPICGFCGRTHAEVKKLIAGPASFICNECVETCHEILEEEQLLRTPEERAAQEEELRVGIEKELTWLRSLYEAGTIAEAVYVEKQRDLLRMIGSVPES